MTKYKEGQIISYTNGSPAIYTGTIKKVQQRKSSTYYLVIDETDAAAVELWNAGYAIGSHICESQIITEKKAE